MFFLFSSIHKQSNSSPHSEDDDKHSVEDYQQSPPQKYLEESPPPEDPEAYAQQQRELLERLKEQFSSFPFHASAFPGLDLTAPPTDHTQRIKSEAQNEFPFSSFPSPPSCKDEIKITSASKKNGSSQNNNSWSYEDQFKQVRQVSQNLSKKKFKIFFTKLTLLSNTHTHTYSNSFN